MWNLAEIRSLNCEDQFVVFNKEHPRKRKRNEAEWKKNKPKQKRHSGEGKITVLCAFVLLTEKKNSI